MDAQDKFNEVVQKIGSDLQGLRQDMNLKVGILETKIDTIAKTEKYIQSNITGVRDYCTREMDMMSATLVEAGKLCHEELIEEVIKLKIQRDKSEEPLKAKLREELKDTDANSLKEQLASFEEEVVKV